MDPPPPVSSSSTSKRELTAAEFEVLGKMLALVQEIAADDQLLELARQGPLGPRFPPEQAEVFVNRFRAVPARLVELMKDTAFFGTSRRVKVSGQLSAGHSADTEADTKDKDDSKTVLWLAPAALAAGQTPAGLTENVLTVIHELTHSLEPDAGFPVKDFAYQGSWAYGLLPPDCVLGNADSYRHLAALVAQKRTREPTSYMPPSAVPRQREILLESGLTNLCHALALANFVLDRAWIRVQDCQRFARGALDPGVWGDLERPDTRRPDDAQLRSIEDWLRKQGIVGERESGFWGLSLAAADIATVDKICAFLTWAKGIIGGLTIALSGSGVISYDRKSRKLSIPSSCLGLGTLPLAKEILSVVSEGTPDGKEDARGGQDPLVNTIKNRVDLMFKLINCDRHDLQDKVIAICKWLTKDTAQALPPTFSLVEINAKLDSAKS